MPDIYSYISYAQARQQLANRLYDPLKQFWSDAELGLNIKESLRTWNAMTNFWRGDFLFNSQQGVTWYDLTDIVNLPNTLRPLTITDVGVYTDIQYALLEPAVGVNPWTGVSKQFTADDLVNAVQRRRDEILSVTGCFTTRRLVGAVPSRVYLPDTVIDVRRMAYIPATPVNPSDSFHRANVNPIGSPWIPIGLPGFVMGQVLNNQYVGQTGKPTDMLYAAAGVTWSPNQSSQATLRTLNPGKGYAGLYVRVPISAGGVVGSGYQFLLDGVFGGQGIGLPTGAKISNATGFIASTVITPQAGDVFKLQAVGSTISVFQNGALILSVVDTLATSGIPGILASPSNGVATDVAWDNWVGTGGNINTTSPMFPEDSWAEQSFQQNYLQLPAGTPLTYLLSTEPPIAFDVDRPPGAAGQYELLTVEAGQVLSTTAPSTFTIPNDWIHLIKWGALADLLGRESNAKDVLRAKYCEQRYRMGLSLLSTASALLTLRIANTVLQIDSVRDADLYRTTWEAEAQKKPDMAFHSGLNLIGLASTPDGVYSLTATVVENAPMPANDTSNLQVAREDLDAVLDYAQHIASFKLGGTEFLSTASLFERFLKQAGLYNSKLAEMGEFTPFLLDRSQRQENMAPRTTPDADEGS